MTSNRFWLKVRMLPWKRDLALTVAGVAALVATLLAR